MKTRCPWVPNNNQLYIDYHDQEWGVPVHDDTKHFEFLVLEGAQAGISWETILKRREGYRRNYANFNPERVAEFDDKIIQEMLSDKGIIRNRLKVKSSINNSRLFIDIQKEYGSFDTYIWEFVGNATINHSLKELKDYPIFIKEAEMLSKELKSRGFTFVGPTIMYAHMQACGLVNDHTTDCFRYKQIKQIQK